MVDSRDVLRVVLIWVIILALLASISFSLRSFTGYVVDDKISTGKNVVAFIFFLIGIFGSFILFKKFKRR